MLSTSTLYNKLHSIQSIIRYCRWRFLVLFPFLIASFFTSTSSLFANDTATRLYPQLESAAAQTLGGNWEVTLTDKEGTVVNSAHIVMMPPTKSICDAINEQDCYFRKVDNKEGEWKSSYVGESISYNRGFKIVDSKNITFSHAYGIAGHWGGESKIAFDAGVGSGIWTYKDSSGPERWRRLRPKIDKVGFGEILAGTAIYKHRDDSPANLLNYGSVGRVTGKYDSWWWGRNRTAPGSRPIFSITMYGENLWGYHVTDFKASPGFYVQGCNGITQEGSGKFIDHIGLRCFVTVMTGTTRGTKVFRLDNLEIPFNFNISGLPEAPQPQPAIEIEAFNSEGESEVVTGGHPFRAIVRYPAAPDAPPQTINILSQQGGQIVRTVALRRTSDPKIFATQWFYPLFSTLDEFREDGPLREGETLEATTPELQARLASDFAGDWMIVSESSRGGHGVATMGSDGELRLGLSRDGVTKYYHSIATTAYRSIDDPTEVGRYLAFMTLSQGEHERSQPAASGELLLLPNTETLTLQLNSDEKNFDVEPTGIGGGMFVDLPTVSPERMSGSARIFYADTENIELTRNTRYLGAVVLDDQWPSGKQSPEDLRAMSYPFGPRLTVGASFYRNILIFGENLPESGFATSSDEKIEHRYATTATRSQVTATLEALGIDHPDDFEGLIVPTLLLPNVAPGRKNITINGATLPWDLQFADSMARYLLLRETESNVYEPVTTLYEGDVFRVAARALGGPPLPEASTVKLGHYRQDDDRLRLLQTEEIRLSRTRIGDESTLISEPITFHPFSTYQGQNPIPPRHFITSVEDRLTLSGEIGGLRVVPPTTQHVVDRYSDNTIWNNAIELAETCSDNVRNTSHWIITNIFSSDRVTQTVESTVKHHAAAILLANATRDALVEHRKQLLPIRGENGVQAIIDFGRKHRGPFWSVLKADVDGVGSEPLFELLRTPDSLVRRWGGKIPGLTPETAKKLAHDTVKRVFNHHLEQMDDAIWQLKRVHHCDYEGLLKMVAHRASNAPQRILPQLVRGEGKFNQTVVPDEEARITVKYLYTKGDEVKAFKQWASVDTAVVAAFASIATFGAAEVLALGGYAVAAAILGGSDAVIGVGLGINGAAAHYQASRFSDYAEGARSVLGEQTLSEAIREEPNIFLTAAGVILPAVSGQQVLQSLRGGNLTRGAKLAKELKDFSPEELARLSQSDAIDLAAYVASTEKKLVDKGRLSLSTDEQRAYNLLRRATGTGPKVPTRATAPSLVDGELSANMTRAEFDALSQPGANLTPEQLQRKIDAILSGRFNTRPATTEPSITVTEVAGEAGQARRVRLEAPSLPSAADSADPNKTLILDLELPPPAADYGHRLMQPEELADFARNPRVRINPDASRLQQRNEVFVPWQEIDGVDAVDGVVRRSRWATMDEAPRLRLDGQVRKMIDEAAAIGNPWAKRLHRDIRSGEYNYYYEPALPDNYGGVAIRANDNAGHGALGALNPFELTPNGNYILRTPEAISRDLIHEYSHAWRGGQPFIDELRGASGTGVLRGEYNEVRAFIAESRFQRDVGIARQLNGRPYLAPADNIVGDAAAALPANSPGLSGGTRLRNQTALLLENHPEYMAIYQTTAERFLGLSPSSGGSTIALQQRMNRLDTFLAGPQFSHLPDAARQVWREQMLQQMIDDAIVR